MEYSDVHYHLDPCRQSRSAGRSVDQLVKTFMESQQNPSSSADNKKIAFQFIILMGAVSLFGDITYEGARSITGPYLAVLGASAGIVGLVAGFGEFIGYGLRLPSVSM